MGSRECRSRAEPLVPTRRWLLWETAADGSVVGGAVLRWQQNTHVGPKHLQGGAVLEYIAARRDKGAKGYLMVLAAEEVCRLMGLPELFSACDLTHKGQAFQGRATPALEAHRRWGFQDINPEEWRERRFHQYSRDSRVWFMTKPIS